MPGRACGALADPGQRIAVPLRGARWRTYRGGADNSSLCRMREHPPQRIVARDVVMKQRCGSVRPDQEIPDVAESLVHFLGQLSELIVLRHERRQLHSKERN